MNLNKGFKELIKDEIKIVKFSKKHLTKKYVHWLNNKDVNLYSELRHYKHSIKSCMKYYSDMKKSENLFLAIEYKLTSEHIGNISVYYDKYNDRADISIMIGEKKYWGNGYGLKSWNMILNYLLTECKIRIVTAGTQSINHAMLKIFENSGMKIDSKRKNFFLNKSKQIDLITAYKINTS